MNMERLKNIKDTTTILNDYIKELGEVFKKQLPKIAENKEFAEIFSDKYFEKPVILIIDEFDALEEEVINGVVSLFRDIYMYRRDDISQSASQKKHRLHGVALIGVRSVLGIENVKGSPFNVQRSVHIPNLTFEEVKGMFDWYTRESGQTIEPEVVETLYYETLGQPGLISWFGELLTKEYNKEKDKPITLKHWKHIFAFANAVLPNNTILNLISKAKNETYKPLVLKLFETQQKIKFAFDNKDMNYLYMNGVIDYEIVDAGKDETYFYMKFSSPFVQKRLFNYFSNELYSYTGKLIEPFDNLDDAITESSINLRNLMKRYEAYLDNNRNWLFKDAPRRSDNRIYEAVYHFNIYRYLYDLFEGHRISIYPEFPTGNGKIDLLLNFKGKQMGIELKSFSDLAKYRIAINQAAQYAKSLKLSEINLLFFITKIDDKNRQKFEIDYIDPETGVKVIIVFAQTGE